MTNLLLQLQLKEINNIDLPTIRFGISFYRMRDYVDSECANFIQRADSLNDDELIHRYREFLVLFAEGKITPNTLVATDIMEIFCNDVENRASIDYLDGHYSDDPEIWKGGKYFHERGIRLRAHIDKALAVDPVDNSNKGDL